MRYLWTPQQQEGFIRDWLVLGEFPNPPHEGLEHYDHTPPCVGCQTDYLVADDGESMARPKEGDMVQRPDGSQATWTKVHIDGHAVNLMRLFHEQGRPTSNGLAYAYAEFEWAEDGPAVLSLGSDDGVQAWLNGELVLDLLVHVQPRKGTNRLLCKIENGLGGWGVCARVLDIQRALCLAERPPQARLLDDESTADEIAVLIAPDPLRALRDGRQGLTVRAVAGNGRVVGARAAVAGSVVRFPWGEWPDGPYEIQLEAEAADGQAARTYLALYRGDWRVQVKQLLDEVDRLPDHARDVETLRRKLIRTIIVDRLGGDPRSAEGRAVRARWQSIHAYLMEWTNLAQPESERIHPAGWRSACPRGLS
jgi:hypothetical protein